MTLAVNAFYENRYLNTMFFKKIASLIKIRKHLD